MGQNFGKCKVLVKSLFGTALLATAFTGSALAADPAPGLTTTIYGRLDAAVTSSGGARALNADGSKSTYNTTRLSQGQGVNRLGLRGAYQFEDPTLKVVFGVEMGTSLLNGNAGGVTANSTQNCAALSPANTSKDFNAQKPDVTATTTLSTSGGETTATTTVGRFVSVPCNTSNVLFNRGYTVGLASTTFGSLEFGNMYMAPFWVILASDKSLYNLGLSDTSALFASVQPGALGRYLSDPVASVSNKSGTNTAVGAGAANTGTAGFYANSLRIRTPALYGVTTEVSYSIGQNASGINNLYKDGQTIAANIMYNDGPLFVGVAHMTYAQVNDIASPTSRFSDWRTRYQNTEVLGARYKIADLTVGAAFTLLRVTSAGDYTAMGYGVSSAYDLTAEHRVEASFGITSASNTASKGAYGANLGRTTTVTNEDGSTTTKSAGDPQTISYGVTYLYSIAANTKAYLGYIANSNNSNADLGVGPFRSDTAKGAWGSSPYSVAAGMFLAF
ncbi:MAG: porin [Alphaproteobacteria bacterium]|nr:porin [Alphaproteobacteria bacterium]